MPRGGQEVSGYGEAAEVVKAPAVKRQGEVRVSA